ncbi:MAG: nuclear transport factor 2 family protein [Novosphingobium sp.]|nr:nuclear transport factor 2 family protein [Novosphingobium sp.]
MAATLAELERRLHRAEARLAIMALEAEYARSWDAGDARAWAALFTADGVFDMAAVGANPRSVMRGTAELEGFCRQVDSIYRGLHFMHLPWLDIGEETARGRLHFQWIGLQHAGAGHFGRRDASGYYDVTYALADGEWKIRHRLEKAITGTVAEHFDVYLAPEPLPPE